VLNASAVGRISVPPPASERRPFNVPPKSGVAAGDGELSGATWLAAGLRGLMGIAQDTCRLRAVSPTLHWVEYRTPESRRGALHGVHTCKSPLCPFCAPNWQRTRSDEITRAIDAHAPGPDAVFFVTLTMRHHRRMALSLQHRLLTAAFGSLWAGNQGNKAALKLGGKPETIRAHDRTWSNQHGWHPHIHALLFARDAGLSTEDLARLLDKRWPRVLGSTLRRFRRQLQRIITRSDSVDENGVGSGRGGCGRADCSVCQVRFQGPRREFGHVGPVQDGETLKRWREPALGSYPLAASEQQGECWHFRERATRLFGVRMFPRRKREAGGVFADGSPRYVERVVPIHDSALRALRMLESFTVENIKPTRSRGAFVERMRDRDRLPRYLAKLGLELASSLDKVGRVDERGIRHFSHWEVARLACEHGHPLREAARKAWSKLFWATRGTQTITFSDREALGLPDDPLAEGVELDEQQPDETRQLLATIEAPAFRAQVAARGHVVIAELASAYERGALGELAYVDPVSALRLVRHPETAPRDGPPSTADPEALDAAGYLVERPDPGLRGEAPSIEARLAEVEAGGSTVIGAAYRESTALPSGDSGYPEQVKRRLKGLWETKTE
jgi:hypothetical protein